MVPFRYYQMLVSPHLGGAAMLAMAIHRHVVAHRGPVSQLLLPAGSEAERTAREHGFPFIEYRVDRLSGPSRLLTAVENLRLYRGVATGRGLIHVHSPFVYGAARILLGTSKLSRVLHLHLDYTLEELRWAFRVRPHLVILSAEFLRAVVDEALASRPNKGPAVRVIPNAVDTGRFFRADRNAAKASIGVDANDPLAMVVANLAPHKGQETAVRAIAALQAMGYTLRLWLVGHERECGGSYTQCLRNLCVELGVAHLVSFVGFRKDTPELFKAADFLLLPSTRETTSLVMLEAQASGAVVLAAPTGGIPAVIKDSRTGYLIAADDFMGYARRLAALLANPGESARISEAASQFVAQNHGMSRYCERVLEEYDALLEGS